MSKQCPNIFVMSNVLPMASLHSLGHTDQNEVKLDFFTQVMPLASTLMSFDAKCIINGTILLIR